MPALSSAENAAQALKILERRIEEVGRSNAGGSLCRVVLTADAVGLSGDVFAQGAWSAVEGAGMFTAGSTGVNSTITISTPGVYEILLVSYFNGPTSGAFGNRVVKNGTAFSGTIARGEGAMPPSASLYCNGHNFARLARGDVLRWMTYCGTSATLKGDSANTQAPGSYSSLTIRRVGP